MRLHADEVVVDAERVSALVAAQFPDLAGLPVTPVANAGTVNAVFRLGDGLTVRLPRQSSGVAALEHELRWLPRLAPTLPLRVPTPVETGRPALGYPFGWAIYRWLDGAAYAVEHVRDETETARELAAFVLALRAIDPDGAPRGGRPTPAASDAQTREAIRVAGPDIDQAAATRAWERALEVPEWSGEAVWIHTDLLPSNLLIAGGRLAAVLDFGGAAVGDPAGDAVPAWSVFGVAARETYRAALAVDDLTWERARGIALSQALTGIPYYRTTHPAFAAMSRRTLDRILSEG